jgi:hypothetical protein
MTVDNNVSQSTAFNFPSFNVTNFFNTTEWSINFHNKTGAINAWATQQLKTIGEYKDAIRDYDYRGAAETALSNTYNAIGDGMLEVKNQAAGTLKEVSKNIQESEIYKNAAINVNNVMTNEYVAATVTTVSPALPYAGAFTSGYLLAKGAINALTPNTSKIKSAALLGTSAVIGGLTYAYAEDDKVTALALTALGTTAAKAIWTAASLQTAARGFKMYTPILHKKS